MKKPALLVDEADVYYFSGALMSGGAVLITEKGNFFIAKDAESAERGRIKNVIKAEKSVPEALGKKMKELGISKVRAPVRNMSVSQCRSLLKKVKLEDNTGEIERMRMVKSRDEVSRIKKACSYADEAMKAAKDAIRIGVTEKKIRAEALSAVMGECGDQSFPMIVASGKNSMLTHCYPSGKKIKEKEMIIIDLGFSHEGYQSDLTRTFAVNPSEKQVELYETVKKAQGIAVKSVREKKLFSEADREVRNFFKKQNLAEFWKYSLGHGVGIEVHESPSINEKSRHIAEKGMIFALEPGLHVPGTGGCRIEDTFLLEKKPAALTKFPKELFV